MFLWNIFNARPQNLFKGHTTSCGCNSSYRRLIDLTGRKIGRYTVLELLPKNNKNYREYRCLCECGNIKIVKSKLLGRNSNSCGCLAREIRIATLERNGFTKTGSQNPHYNPNLTEQDRQRRDMINENKEWSKSILKKDNYICKLCKQHTNELEE